LHDEARQIVRGIFLATPDRICRTSNTGARHFMQRDLDEGARKPTSPASHRARSSPSAQAASISADVFVADRHPAAGIEGGIRPAALVELHRQLRVRDSGAMKALNAPGPGAA